MVDRFDSTLYKNYLDADRRKATGGSLGSSAIVAANLKALQSFNDDNKKHGGLLSHIPSPVKGAAHHIFDALSRGTYAVTGLVDYGTDPNRSGAVEQNEADTGLLSKLGISFHPGAALHGAVRGLEGKDKKEFSQLIGERYPGISKKKQYGLGFGADILGDPLNLVPGLGLVKLPSAAKSAAAQAVKDAASATSEGAGTASKAAQVSLDVAKHTDPSQTVKTVTDIPGFTGRTLTPTIKAATEKTPALQVLDRLEAKTGTKITVPAEAVKTGTNAPVAKILNSVKATKPYVSNIIKYNKEGKILLSNETKAAITKQLDAEEKAAKTGTDTEKIAQEIAKKDPAASAFTWKDIKADKLMYDHYINKAVEAGAAASNFDRAARQKQIIAHLVDTEKAKEVASVSKPIAETIKEAVRDPRSLAPVTEVAVKDADLAAGMQIAEKFARTNIPANTFKARNAFNPAKMRNLHSEIRRVVLQTKGGYKKVGMSTRHAAQVNAIYKVAEREVERLTGQAAVHYNGTAFRLSDVIDHLPKNVLVTDKVLSAVDEALKSKAGFAAASKDVQTAIEGAHKVATIQDAVKIAPIAEKASDLVEEAQHVSNPLEQAGIKKSLPKQMANEATATGASKAAVDSISDTTKALVQKLQIPPVVTRMQTTLPIMRNFSESEAELAATNFKRLVEINEALDKTAGVGARAIGIIGLRGADGITKGHAITGALNSYASVRNVASTKAGQWLAEIFSPAFGTANIHNVVRTAEASANAFATARTKEVRELFTHPNLYTVDQQIRALKNIRPEIAAHDPGAAALAEHINRLIGNKDSFFATNGLKLKEVNDALLHQFGHDGFKFEKTVVIDGVEVLRSKLPFDEYIMHTVANWANKGTVEGLKSKSPVANLVWDMGAAMEKAVAHNQSLAQLTQMFGDTAKHAGWQTVTHPRLKGFNFPPEIAPQIEKHLKQLAEVSDPKSDFVRNYDKAMSVWKQTILTYSPAYHIRNLQGDTWINFMEGVSNPVRYQQAAKIQTYANRIKAGEEFFDHTKPLSQIKSERRIITHKKYGPISADQFLTAYYRYGGPQNFAHTENLGNAYNAERKITAPFKGGLKQHASNLSEGREDFGRLPQLVDLVAKSKAPNLDKAMEEAMGQVRRAHFDYGDITKAEQEVFKRIIPFYTWLRKSTPYIIEKTLEKPWRAAVVPKANFAISGMLGQDPQSLSTPYPQGVENLFPEWMKETAGAQWGTHEGNSVLGNIQDPLSGFLTSNVNNPVQGILSGLTPAVKIPAELATGTQIFGKIPIQDKTKYLDAQIPGISNLGRITNTSPVTGLLESILSNPAPGSGFQTKPGLATDTGGASNKVALLNFLSGLGLSEDTLARQKSAEYEQAHGSN